MADDIEYITFDNDEIQTSTGSGAVQTANVNGTLEVDYTTGTVNTINGTSGLTVTGTGFEDQFSFYNSPLGDTNGLYDITFTGTPNVPKFEASYSTETPGADSTDITFNSDPGQADNTEYNSNGPATVTSSTTSPVTCFVTGTAVATDRGPVNVEDLAVGDLALTSSGAPRRICWIGHRTLDCRRHARPAEIMPIRIAAHAFGAALPSRDLLVSPGHAICVDAGGEKLIPAGALLNGTSIVQQDVASVTYWHVELEAHDVLLAENLPCESYLDMGNRGFFAESGVVDLAASPDAPVRTHADFCRPFHDGGAVVEAVRARLATRDARTETTRVAA